MTTVAEANKRLFQRRPEGIAVRLGVNEFEMVSYPEGYTPLIFQGVLAGYTAGYRKRGRTPSASEVYEEWRGAHVDSIGEIMLTPEFKQAMNLRGVDVGDYPGLTILQHAVLIKMSDPLDKRGAKQILDELGVTTTQYANWKKNKPFAKALDEQTKAIGREVLPEVRRRLGGMAESGNMQAISMVLEMAGEGPKAKEIQNGKDVVMAMLSAVQRHCTPEQREAIAADMKLTLSALQVSQAELAQ